MIKKTPQLRSVVLELRSKLPCIEVRDYWYADLCGIGLAPSSKPSLLIYVSCWRKRPGQVDYSIEEGVIEAGGAVVEEADDVPVSRLIAAIQSRLGSKA
jgi:hypothetical protein